MVPSPSSLLARSMLAFIGLAHGFNLDEVILKDIMYQGSSQCKNGGNTDISFVHTPSPSYWDSVNSNKEPKNFMAQMTHSDSDPNKRWTVRFGKGGSIYSMIGDYGEAIPPQTQSFSSWVDEVTQAVAVDLTQNNCAISSECYFIHQSGTYFEDVTYLNETFYSPNVGKYCEGNTCIFATWGQIAKNPTIFESNLLYFHQYRDCDNGVIEYTQMFVGYFGGQIAYLNMPWAGVRASSLPDLYFSNADSTIADKEDTIQVYGGATEIRPELRTTGGYSTFAQNQASDPVNNAALSYVHGINEEYSDTTNNYFRAPSRIRFGKTQRDFTVFTVNGRITSRNSGNSFVHRQFLINDRLGNIAAQAQPLIREAHGDMLTEADFSGRSLMVYTKDSSIFGVAAASSQGGTSTTCSIGTVQCVGSTVPTSGLVPFFAITCGRKAYFGADKYHFAPSPDGAGLIRAYVCDGQGVGVIPELKLLGFFPEDGSCDPLSNAIYDFNFCGDSSEQPSSSPSKSGSGKPTLKPSQIPSNDPTAAPNSIPMVSPTNTPTRSPTNTPTTTPTNTPTNTPSTTLSPTPSTTPSTAPTTSCGSDEAKVKFVIQTDRRGSDTSYRILMRNKKGKFKKTIMYTRKFLSTKTIRREKCIRRNKCYKFRIKDKGKDGICCEYGKGWYTLTFDNKLVKASQFKNKKNQKFNFGECKRK